MKSKRRRPRILVVEPAGRMWGSEQALLDLLRHIDKSRYDIAVACPGDSPFMEQMQAAGIQAFAVPLQLLHIRGFWARLFGLVSLARVMLRVRPQVVHVNQAGIARLATIASKLVNASVVCHVRLLEDARRMRSRPVDWPPIQQLVAISQIVFDELNIDAAPPVTSIARVYDPFDADAFRQRAHEDSRSAVRAEFGIADSAIVIALAGRVCADKRQDLLIAAALLGSANFYYLIIGGDPPTPVGQLTFREKLIQSVTDSGIANRVIFTGMRDDVAALMMASDVVILASEEEAFGRALLEGLSLGKHIVGPNAGGPGEIIGANERGMAFTPGDPSSLAEAIAETIADERRALARTQLGEQWVREVCSPKHHAAEMMRLYDRLGTASVAHG